MKKENLSLDIYNVIFEKCPVLAAITSKSEGEIIDVNEAFLKSLKFKKEDIIGKTTKELNIWYDYGDRIKMLESLKKDGFLENFQTKIKSNDGTVLDVSFFCRLFSEDILLSYAIEITSFKNVENELRNKNNELEKLNKFFVERELKMSDLKKEVNDLLEKLGQPAKYKI